MTHAPVPTPPSMSTSPTAPQGRVRPSGWWYALVPIVFLAGVGFAVAGAISWGFDIAESYELVGSDGTASVQLDAGDERTVFAVWDDGRSSDSLSRPPAKVTVHGPGGGDVAFEHGSGGGRSTFHVDGQSGIDVGSFTAPSSGTYDVAVEFDHSAGVAPQAAIGEFSFGGLAERIMRPLGFGLAASVALLVALLVARGTSKRRLRESPQFQGPTPVTGGTNPSNGPFV